MRSILCPAGSSYTKIYPLNPGVMKRGAIGERSVRTSRVLGGKVVSRSNYELRRQCQKGESHGPELPEDLCRVMPDLVGRCEDIGGRKEGAQVHPYQFRMSIVRFAWERGANSTIGWKIRHPVQQHPPPPRITPIAILQKARQPSH
ncbi:hypothetical protein HOY80DRAFT_951947 [Tuber brumale]|nr:hypothetical protein HOY80DRAFT_951947 [Tuber brumale]